MDRHYLKYMCANVNGHAAMLSDRGAVVKMHLVVDNRQINSLQAHCSASCYFRAAALTRSQLIKRSVDDHEYDRQSFRGIPVHNSGESILPLRIANLYKQL